MVPLTRIRRRFVAKINREILSRSATQWQFKKHDSTGAKKLTAQKVYFSLTIFNVSRGK